MDAGGGEYRKLSRAKKNQDKSNTFANEYKYIIEFSYERLKARIRIEKAD